MSVTDWLDELDQIRQEDEQKREEQRLDLSVLGSREKAIDALRVSDAHNLLRRVQHVLLSGKGRIDIFDTSRKYDRGIALVWQGPVSQARIPNTNDPDDYRFILVGAIGQDLYVNDRKLESMTPEALQRALVWAAKNPKVKTRRKESKGSKRKK